MEEKAFAFSISFGCPAGRALRGLIEALLRISRDSGGPLKTPPFCLRRVPLLR